MIAEFRITGIVQGVGFRPFVYRLATVLDLEGWVLNDSMGVLTQVEGSDEKIEEFCSRLRTDAPPMAVVDAIVKNPHGLKKNIYTGFQILPSPQDNQPQTLISPDIATCPQCVSELKSKGDRRYRYAFTNCTNCGPRYSIIQGIPYDRPLTTMSKFKMCSHCQAEYDNPQNRRFHAQPNACTVCGPRYSLLDAKGNHVQDCGDTIDEARSLIDSGKIVAVKGVGGYHLVCNARDDAAVAQLRHRKHRYVKPLAVMAGSIETAKCLCNIDSQEERLLASPVAPIVLLKKKNEASVSSQVAPGNSYLGIMLPYAPVHHILLRADDLFVMTSANLSEEPIAYNDQDALSRLSGIADYFLVHNRPIAHRVDDSVMRVVNGQSQVLRRARGLAPAPIGFPGGFERNNAGRGGDILALGSAQKNTFTLTKGKLAFTSEHIGELTNLSTLESYKSIIDHYQKLFDVEPSYLACDIHPEYLSTKYAKELAAAKGLPLTEVQHHHAHIASVLGENDCMEDVIGISFDGTGYGDDGAIWGGEFLLANQREYTRLAHFAYVPMPGGEKAAKEPWRLALWLLYKMYGTPEAIIENEPGFCQQLPFGWELLLDATEKGINAPMTSSAGRLFDAMGALLGVCTHNQYEGQAAVMLEQLALEAVKENRLMQEMSFNVDKLLKSEPGADGKEVLTIDVLPAICQLMTLDKISAAYGFHLMMASVILETTQRLSKQTGLMTVAMSGGVFQNKLLLELTVPMLERAGFKVLQNKNLPPNDGCISYGQAVVAAAKLL